MKVVFVALVFVIGFFAVSAEDHFALIDSAANYYTKGKYEMAINAYEKIVNSGYEAAEIYYNLGNVYYKTKQYPEAILNFERAKILAPGDEDINFNLELSKRYVVDKIEVLPQILISLWINKITGAMTSDAWSFLSIITFVLCLVLMSVYLFMRILIIRKIAFWTGVLLFIVSLLTFICAWDQKKEIDGNKQGIVFTSTVNVKSSPDENGTILFVIHEGLKVGVQDKIGEWYKIKLSDGSVGWLKSTDVVII
ncbi:MAG: tetratricopeptide repeat protein [Bacteroidia bacterium]|nr:tetratricopeptide repeat protein [Bacteroidia bacterium]